MSNWRTTGVLRVAVRYHACSPRRWFSSQHHVETVAVECASSGSINVNLHNISQHAPTHPLVIYIPPFSDKSEPVPPLPEFLRPYPTAVINYRWAPMQWPIPILDTLFGYSWIFPNLAPPGEQKRDIYVYGAYNGATLATSLALTENHQDQRMAVRGLLTHNGIYNWTMFLPDHPIHRRRSNAAVSGDNSYTAGEPPYFKFLRQKLPVIFPSPDAMFDVFASPAMFFHYPGLWIPREFDASVTPDEAYEDFDNFSGLASSVRAHVEGKTDSPTKSDEEPWLQKLPPRSNIMFPPKDTTLKIPETLLLHESSPPIQNADGTKKSTRTTKKPKIRNNFEGQATELANFMRRSIVKYEFRDDDDEVATVEAERRVQTRDVGAFQLDGTPGDAGRAAAAAWLKERIGR